MAQVNYRDVLVFIGEIIWMCAYIRSFCDAATFRTFAVRSWAKQEQSYFTKQYHGSQWSGDTSNQGIIRHGIDLIRTEYLDKLWRIYRESLERDNHKISMGDCTSCLRVLWSKYCRIWLYCSPIQHDIGYAYSTARIMIKTEPLTTFCLCLRTALNSLKFNRS